MRVLHIYPVYPKNNFWSSHGSLPFIKKKAAFPPLGLMTVGAMLPKDWEQRLVDMNTDDLEDNQIAWAEMIFISAMIVQEESAREVIARCKKQGKRIVAGGPLFFNAKLEDFPGVDHIFIGEAELTMPLFLKDLVQGTPKSIYESEEKPEMDLSPLFPKIDLIDMSKYVIMPVQGSRGCPHQCEFCSVSAIFGTIMRVAKPSRVIATVQAYFNAGWRGTMMIVDDNFIGRLSWAGEMIDALHGWQKAHHFPFDFIIQASILLADYDALRAKMARTRIKKVFIGIETINDESLKLCHKNQNVGRNMVECVWKIMRSGLQVMAGIIVGLDADNPGIFKEVYDFIQKAGIAVAMINWVLVLPWTKLEKRLKEEGRFIAHPENNPESFGLSYKPKMMDARTLVEGFNWLQEKLYQKKAYYRRVGRMIHYLKPTRGRMPSRLEFRAFFLSLWKIGILSHDWRYFRLLLRTFVVKTDLMTEAVQAAIMHVHYQRVVFDHK
jgi:radical SAM superfamily enzyme YgiQ (UPF0313 family)